MEEMSGGGSLFRGSDYSEKTLLRHICLKTAFFAASEAF